MGLAERFREIEDTLPDDWDSVVLHLATEQRSELDRVAAVMGSMGVGRVGDTLALTVRRAGGAAGPEAARRLFGLLDQDRIWCKLTAGDTSERGRPTRPASVVRSAAASWDTALATLPSDWSNALCLLELDSSTLFPRASLLCAPINPNRVKDAVAFTFRAARREGYGASPGMVRRCLERLDAEGVGARVRVLRLLADTGLVDTQGPIWRVDGRSL